MSKLFPDLYIKSLEELDIEALKNRGIKAIICDIDNTLETAKTSVPCEKTLQWIKKVTDYGMKFYVLSNNNERRVNLFCRDMDVLYSHHAAKPLKFGFKRALRDMNLAPNDVCMIGDQVFADIWGANRMKIYSVLVEKITENESAFARFKRFFERKVLKRYWNEQKK